MSATRVGSKFRLAPAAWLLIPPLLCGLAAWSAPAATRFANVVVERGVPVSMRDGVVLYADVYRPAAQGKFPVLLERTPYDKAVDREIDIGERGAAENYVVIVQDVRGRYTSGGEWYPFRHEAEDGYDTVEWAARLPYANGKVGMFGSSYVGATQMLAATAHPPHLAGICPMFTPSDYYNGWVYLGGAFQQWFDQTWTSILAQNTAERFLKSITDTTQDVRVLPLTRYHVFHLDQALEADNLTAKFAPYYLDWLAHPSDDAYWQGWSIESRYADIDVPSLTVAAWYDIFLGGSLRNYDGVQQHGGSEAARKNQQLLITIGGHAGSGRKIGSVDFGPAADEFDESNLTLEWYDYLFEGRKNRFAAGQPVTIFVMGRNQWRAEPEWPLRRAKTTKYYLHSAGKANSSAGDGALGLDLPGVEPGDRFTYDPQDPVPTEGGPLCCDGHRPPGPRDQGAVEKRRDVLVYTTPPFEKDTEVTGPVRVELYAASSAQDTDFTAKLVDVDAQGNALNLAEGIVRARYRDSRQRPAMLSPGQTYKFAIDLWATSNVFLAGHRMRLEISSSNFPRFDRNLNLGQPSGKAKGFVTATNTVLHDAAHPSALLVPVIP
ncbi:MAG: CocE/NonD family hydrolase [Acidobacteriaceae bacterium]